MDCSYISVLLLKPKSINGQSDLLSIRRFKMLSGQYDTNINIRNVNVFKIT